MKIYRAPTFAGFGITGGMLAVYFTDDWIGKEVLMYVPVIGDKYADERAAREAAAADN